MTWAVTELVAFLDEYVSRHVIVAKADVESAVVSRFGLQKDRAIYFGPEFAVRFSSVAGSAFRNTVASLEKVQKYDKIPFLVCAVRPTSAQVLLANSTFLRKVSHGSHRLTMDNVRGSFLGHDILATFSEIQNVPTNFEALFEMHLQFDWEENLSRLVEATAGITAHIAPYHPSPLETVNILNSAETAAWLAEQAEYRSIASELDGLVETTRGQILKAASIDNVNLRGNAIEQIITQAGNVHTLDDFSRTLTLGPTVAIDIKTKILALKSNPKGYNIDKFLRTLASGDTVFDFYFVGIDLESGRIDTCLLSALDERIIDMSRIQFHWSGRQSRGATQLGGDLNQLIRLRPSSRINVSKAQAFLQALIDLVG